MDEEVIKFTIWAGRQDIPLGQASTMDLHTDPGLLSNYKIVVFAGHSEYWSKEMRDNLENFLAAGGNAMILSGNTMWWQVRFEDKKMIAYKLHPDPLAGQPFE